MSRFHHLLISCLACLLATVAQATPVTLTFEGTFSGSNTGYAPLHTAAAPLLTGEDFTVTLVYDTATAASGTVGDFTLYKAVTSTTASIEGYSFTPNACSSGDFFCSIHVQHGSIDFISLFSTLGSSASLQTAMGAPGSVGLQFEFFYTKFPGNALSDESLGFDLPALASSGMSGALVLFNFRDRPLRARPPGPDGQQGL
ncbi:MAG: hypothetical protein QM776_06530 [Rhodocyclaceae bacterium]